MVDLRSAEFIANDVLDLVSIESSGEWANVGNDSISIPRVAVTIIEGVADSFCMLVRGRNM